MKNIKKLSVTLLSASMIFAGLATTISADEKEKKTTVSYSQKDSFTWSIPDTIDLSGTETKAKEYSPVTVSDLCITPGKEVEITYYNGDDNKITSTANSSLTYAFNLATSEDFENDALASDGDVVLEVPYNSSTRGGSQKIYGQIGDDDHIYAGTFNAQVTFKAAVVDIED